jgi:hypothetical protein
METLRELILAVMADTASFLCSHLTAHMGRRGRACSESSSSPSLTDADADPPRISAPSSPDCGSEANGVVRWGGGWTVVSKGVMNSSGPNASKRNFNDWEQTVSRWPRSIHHVLNEEKTHLDVAVFNTAGEEYT